MGLLTQPQAPRRKLGRGLRIVLGVVFLVFGAAVFVHLYGPRLFQKEPEPERRARPAPSRMAEFPPAEVTPTGVPAAERGEPGAAGQPQRRQPVRAASAAQERPIELGDIALNITPTAIERPDYQDGRQPLQGIGCSLSLGETIPITLITGIFSEVGQQVRGRVQSNIYSSDIGYENKVLIPQGTITVGYTAGQQELTFERGRLGIVWNQMVAPKGSRGFGEDPTSMQVNIGDAFGASADGSGGMGGDVDYHWGKIFLYAAFVTLFNYVQNDAFEDSEAADEAGRTLGNFGNDVLRRTLDWKPEITIPQGAVGEVNVQKRTRVC
jgi:type IV secretory pathway VirB10-like protein